MSVRTVLGLGAVALTVVTSSAAAVSEYPLALRSVASGNLGGRGCPIGPFGPPNDAAILLRRPADALRFEGIFSSAQLKRIQAVDYRRHAVVAAFKSAGFAGGSTYRVAAVLRNDRALEVETETRHSGLGLAIPACYFHVVAVAAQLAGTPTAARAVITLREEFRAAEPPGAGPTVPEVADQGG